MVCERKTPKNEIFNMSSEIENINQMMRDIEEWNENEFNNDDTEDIINNNRTLEERTEEEIWLEQVWLDYLLMRALNIND